jgi:hypothetical protein
LNYLEEKYNETFVIEDLVRQTDIGKPSIIIAKTYSEQYPFENFEVIYHLPADDVYMQEEIIEFLKKIDAYDESKVKLPEGDKSYLEDNYCNIVLQNEFDRDHPIKNVIYAKTVFETTNFYPSIDGNVVTVENYIDSLPCPIYACTMIFVDEKKVEDKEVFYKRIFDDLKVDGIDRQFIYIHYTNKSSEFIEEEFKKYYDDFVMHFKNAEYVIDYEDLFVRKGILQEE